MSYTLVAQYHENVFADIEDNAILGNLLTDHYKTTRVLSYGQARDTFMRNIDLVGNRLECIYTGYQAVLLPNEDPTTSAYRQGINTEHVYPQSKGAAKGTMAHSDMHNLFPAREEVNSARGSLPMAEIEDNLTDKWYINNSSQSSIPRNNIDDYTEVRHDMYVEPRENVKGDMARVMFYFYTMYRDQADQKAPKFFELQRNTLCQWHFQDPVDSTEWHRNQKIAAYQDNKVNPFVLDCRLARLYCPEIAGSCKSVDTEHIAVSENAIDVTPNPFYGYFYSNTEQDGTLSIYTFGGSKILEKQLDVGKHKVDLPELSSGKYIVVYTVGDRIQTQIITKL